MTVTESSHDDTSLAGFPVPITPFPSITAHAIEKERAAMATAAETMRTPLIGPDCIVYEDNWMIVMNKPSGIYCEYLLASSYVTKTPVPTASMAEPHIIHSHSPKVQFKNNYETTTANTNEKSGLYLANRLDRDTSGLIVLAKDKKIAGKLGQSFAARQIEKSYIALCFGQLPSWKEILVQTGHGRSRHGMWRVYHLSDVGRGLPGGSIVKEMSTLLTVVGPKGNIRLRSLPYQEMEGSNNSFRLHSQGDGDSDSSDSGFFLLKARPITGRTHQIRLHCEHVGLPLAGDVRYGGPQIWQNNGRVWNAHALHSFTLSLPHPDSGVELNLTAPLPDWAAGFKSL